MRKPAALLVLPSQKITGEEKDALQATAQSLTKCLEDLNLGERVGRALRATRHAQLRVIDITVHEHVVTLRGRVSSYYRKQIAQAAALAVPGVVRVRNELVVSRTS